MSWSKLQQKYYKTLIEEHQRKVLDAVFKEHIERAMISAEDCRVQWENNELYHEGYMMTGEQRDEFLKAAIKVKKHKRIIPGGL